MIFEVFPVYPGLIVVGVSVTLIAKPRTLPELAGSIVTPAVPYPPHESTVIIVYPSMLDVLVRFA